MELWIRVQKNKELKQGLVKVEDLIVDKYSDREWCICQSCDTLGIYKTEKRALEVLDEIQSKLKQQFIVKNDMMFSQKDIDKEEYRLTRKYDKEFIMQDSGFEILPINNNVVIYEMPKE